MIAFADHRSGQPRVPPSRTTVAGLLGLALAATFTPSARADGLPLCPVTDGMTASYDILRGGNVIGRHTLRFTRRGPDLVVDVTVDAAISVLGVRVYHYEHRGKESWHDGRMVAMATRTDDDGAKRQVDASLDPATGAWRGTLRPAPAGGPLLATSLWNSQTVRQTRLLDHETGEVTPVRAVPAGGEILKLGDRQVSAAKFDMTGGTTGSVWYDASGCWVQALFASPVDGSQIEVRAR